MNNQRLVLRDLLDGPLPTELGAFVPLWPGVEILPLYGIGEDGRPFDPKRPSAAFLRYAAGARVPEHRHAGYEHIFVLRGSQSDRHGSYPAGTCVMSPPGTTHAVSSEEGCLVLAVWNQSVEVL